jgi:hypothetical protein
MERFTLRDIGVTHHFPKFGVALAEALKRAHLELGYELILKPTSEPDRAAEAGDFEPRFITHYSGDLKVHARQAFLWHRDEPLENIKSILEMCIEQPIRKGWFPTIFFDGSYDDKAYRDVFGHSCYEESGAIKDLPEQPANP